MGDPAEAAFYSWRVSVPNTEAEDGPSAFSAGWDARAASEDEGRWMAFFGARMARRRFFVAKKEDQLRLTAKAESRGLTVVVEPPEVPVDTTQGADAFLGVLE